MKLFSVDLHGPSLALLIVLTLLLEGPAQAGLLTIASKAAANPSGEAKAFKEILKNDDFYALAIKDLASRSSGSAAKTNAKILFREELLSFALDSELVWRRSDLKDFLGGVLGKNCGANVSCQIAFDLTPSEIDGLLSNFSTLMKERGLREPDVKLRDKYMRAAVKLYDEVLGPIPVCD